METTSHHIGYFGCSTCYSSWTQLLRHFHCLLKDSLLFPVVEGLRIFYSRSATRAVRLSSCSTILSCKPSGWWSLNLLLNGLRLWVDMALTCSYTKLMHDLIVSTHYVNLRVCLLRMDGWMDGLKISKWSVQVEREIVAGSWESVVELK